MQMKQTTDIEEVLRIRTCKTREKRKGGIQESQKNILQPQVDIENSLPGKICTEKKKKRTPQKKKDSGKSVSSVKAAAAPGRLKTPKGYAGAGAGWEKKKRGERGFA